MPEMPRMPEKPTLPRVEPAVKKQSGRGGLLLAAGLLLGLIAIFFSAVPALIPLGLIALGPFLLVGLHYLLWGRNWSEKIRAQVAAEEAAEIAAGKRQPELDLPADEPWLRGEERE